MKKIITLALAAVLSACTSIPSESALLERLNYLRTLDCKDLLTKLEEYRATSGDGNILASRSKYMAQGQIDARCTEPKQKKIR
jgi:hypothetical protein